MDNLQARITLLLERWHDSRTIGYRSFPSGNNNQITDVQGVSVGHSTLSDQNHQTGVTAILPMQGNIYQKPLPCGFAVLNGFSKPTGLIQIEELGVLETPIILTNTLCVGRGFSGLVRYMIKNNPEIGRSSPTVNPLVLECNDGYLNDIQAMAVSEELVIDTLLKTSTDFDRGSVGAGRGMSCFSLKGGIGTSSCYISTLKATLGVLVIMATDAPLNARQLKRVAKRAGAGLGRLGSYWGHGSGDIAVAFSTKTNAEPFDENKIEPLLKAAAEATEDAVLDALLQATPVTGFQGHQRHTLADILDQLSAKAFL